MPESNNLDQAYFQKKLTHLRLGKTIIATRFIYLHELHKQSSYE
jgi:hypothetical protein